MSDVKYLAIALRVASGDEVEADFLIDGDLLVIDAAEVINPEQIAEAHDSMKSHYPHCKIMVTHTALLNMLCISADIDKLEERMRELGVKPQRERTDRISKAFG